MSEPLSEKTVFRDRIEAFVLNVLKIGEPFHILKAETIDNGRKKRGRSAMYYIAVLTNSKVQEAFPAEQRFQDTHRFP